MTTRREHRRATLLRLSAAATEAFDQHGSRATIDEIAEAAGVSRRTVFRYVASKEDLAYIHPVLWFDIFDEAVAEAADQPLRDRLMHASRQISAHIDKDPLPVRRAMAVTIADPVLMRGNAAINRRWIERIAAEIRGEATDAETIFRATVLGAAVMGVIDAALGEWYFTEPAPPLVDLVERGLDYLSPIFD